MLHHIKVNLPESESDYLNGNGEGVWVLVQDDAKEAHDTDANYDWFIGILDNDSIYYPHLQSGSALIIEMRGTHRPVVPFLFLSDFHTFVSINEIKHIRWAYMSYTRRWCMERGYRLEDETANGFANGECYVSFEEYCDFEYIDDVKTIKPRLCHAHVIGRYMVSEGTTQTSYGNWIFYFNEIRDKFNLELTALQICDIAAYLEAECEEVSDVEVESKSFSVNFYTNFCPNLEGEE